MPNKPYKNIKCGSFPGYQKHYRQKEKPCDLCKFAAAQYYKNNKETLAKRVKQSQKNNPELTRLIKRRAKIARRARLKGVRVEKYTLEEVLNTYGRRCYLCNKAIDLTAPRNCTGNNWEKGLHIDHVVDIQHGGEDTLENVRPTHAICNIQKSKKNPHRRSDEGYVKAFVT